MNRDDIIRMAREAGGSSGGIWGFTVIELERFFKLAYEAGAAAERERMKSEGWRQCAKGQRTTQFCGMLEDTVAAEREACAKLVEPDDEHRRDALWGYIGSEEGVEMLDGIAAAIRARGQA